MNTGEFVRVWPQNTQTSILTSRPIAFSNRVPSIKSQLAAKSEWVRLFHVIIISLLRCIHRHNSVPTHVFNHVGVVCSVLAGGICFIHIYSALSQPDKLIGLYWSFRYEVGASSRFFLLRRSPCWNDSSVCRNLRRVLTNGRLATVTWYIFARRGSRVANYRILKQDFNSSLKISSTY